MRSAGLWALVVLVLAMWQLPVAMAADFVHEPQLACDWFKSLGLKTTLSWSRLTDQGDHVCQYSDQFGRGPVGDLRAGKAVLDMKSKKVQIFLSIQSFSQDEDRAYEALLRFAKAFYAAQGQAYPAQLTDWLLGDSIDDMELRGVTFSQSDEELWRKQHAVAMTLSVPASAAMIQKALRKPSAAELAQQNQLQANLAARCDAAIESAEFDGKPALTVSSYKRAATKLMEGEYLFEYKQSQKQQYTCRVCADNDEGLNCGFMMGALVEFTAPDAGALPVPAELDRKCVGALQKELQGRQSQQFVDHALVKRIAVLPIHTAKSYVYQLTVAPTQDLYRCVVRKKDLTYQVDRVDGDGHFSGMAAGVMR